MAYLYGSSQNLRWCLLSSGRSMVLICVWTPSKYTRLFCSKAIYQSQMVAVLRTRYLANLHLRPTKATPYFFHVNFFSAVLKIHELSGSCRAFVVAHFSVGRASVLSIFSAQQPFPDTASRISADFSAHFLNNFWRCFRFFRTISIAFCNATRIFVTSYGRRYKRFIRV